MSSILFLFILFLVFTGLFSTTASSSKEEEKAEKEPHICKECGSEIFDEEDGESHNHKFYFQIMAVGNPRQMKSLRQILVPNAKVPSLSTGPKRA